MVFGMLSLADHWMEIAATAVDALLLGRVLLLRLNRLYVYITLACLLGVFFDVVGLWPGMATEVSRRIFLYSRYIYALVFPLAAWDVFEEMKPQISKLRRLAATRLIMGLFFATMFGFLISLFAQNADASGEPSLALTLSLVLWAGSSTATLGFLWSVHRGIRAQNLERPNNTSVWMVYFELAMIGEVLSCFYSLVIPFMKPQLTGIFDIVFNTYGMAITAWCILKLRRLPSGVPSTPANASL